MQAKQHELCKCKLMNCRKVKLRCLDISWPYVEHFANITASKQEDQSVF